MNEPKMPEESNDWEAINIYLFTNGQQYTPPRKYHLVVDELKSWDKIITYLAQSQYGPQTSKIELYSLDGKKINNPLELTDSTAYVAIIPPEEFIQTGYSQYLIKASKSWEKRQERFLKSEDMTIAVVTEDGNITNVQSKSELTSRVECEKIVDDLKSVGPILDNAVVNSSKTVNKTNPSINTSQLRKNNIVIKRQQNKTIIADKNKLNDPKFSKSIENQINSKRKEVSYMKCIKGPLKRPSILTKNMNDNILKPNHNLKTAGQNTSKIKKVSKAEVETELKTILSNQNTSINKSEININFMTPEVDLKTTQMNTIHKEREKIQPTQIDKPFLDKSNLLVQQNEAGYKTTNNLEKAEDSLSIIENRIKSLPKVRQTKDQGISINRGGVIKLKFNIEVRDFQAYSNQDKRDSLKATQSYIPSSATEKASQININMNLSDVTLLKYDKDFLKREESLETLLTINRDIFSNNENPKIIIINCSCHQFDADSKSIQMQSEKNRGNLIYLLSNIENDNKTEICTCDKNDLNTKREDLAPTDYFTNKNMDRRVSISPDALYHTQKTSTGMKETENDTTELQKKISLPQNELIKQDVQTQSDVTNQNLQIEQTNIEPTMVKYDKYTQTEWCNILLEARRQEDGHYALYLPPLKVLLQNNF